MRTYTNPGRQDKVDAGERGRVGLSTPVPHEPRPAVIDNGRIFARSTGTGPAEGDGGTTNLTELHVLPKAPVIQHPTMGRDEPRGLADDGDEA